MGSPCEIRFYCENEKLAQQHFNTLYNEVLRLEKKYTRYKPDSVTSTINQSAGTGKKVKLDEESAALLNYANQLYQQSDGLFDITSGILRQIWDFKSQQCPSTAQIEQLLPCIGWPKVELDNTSIYLPQKGMEVDFGGFVKEFATDTVSVLALNLGIKHGLINLGGDIRILGPHLDGDSWRIGIQHPRTPKQAIAVIDVHEGALATSGDYERYMIVNGKRYCHLLNPKTGLSIQPDLCSVSILAEACLIAGSFSTIAMLKSSEYPNWLAECGLPYLSFDTALKPNGSIGSISES